MKKSVFFSLIIAGLILSCTQQKEIKSPIEGVWQVVSWKGMSGDTLIWKLGVDYTGTEIKIWSGNYFNFVGCYTRQKDTTIEDNYGGGTYELEGTHYEESYLYCVEKSWVGTSQKLLLEIKNDTLIQTWPCDKNWQIDKSNYNIQKLIRKE
jgi:hypothetical protein